MSISNYPPIIIEPTNLSTHPLSILTRRKPHRQNNNSQYPRDPQHTIKPRQGFPIIPYLSSGPIINRLCIRSLSQRLFSGTPCSQYVRAKPSPLFYKLRPGLDVPVFGRGAMRISIVCYTVVFVSIDHLYVRAPSKHASMQSPQSLF